MIDLTEEENFDYDVIGAILGKLDNPEFIVVEIEIYKADKTSFEYECFDSDYFNEDLSNLIDRNDFKNGCRYDEEKNEFQIVGSLCHHLDIYNTEYTTQDIVTVRFKKSERFIDLYEYEQIPAYMCDCKDLWLES